MLRFERDFWRRAPQVRLAGVDEAGRGPLAGPVVAAAVSMDPDFAERAYRDQLRDLTDSKLLTPDRRERFAALIRDSREISRGVGWVEAAEIDDLGIQAATILAMSRAVAALPLTAGHLLVDGRPLNGLPCPSTAIVKGDRQSLLIAAASVLAKVSRDRRMREIDRQYPAYGFARHKGYGTAQHMQALLRFGPCPEHRREFRPVADACRVANG